MVRLRPLGGPVKIYLATSLALVRLLARVHAGMHGQSGALDELLSTSRIIAHVRTNTAVDTLWRRNGQSNSGRERSRTASDLPCRAKSLLRAKRFPQVLQGYALGG